jgi:23S rRNA (guanosine2251-2'-O)-methyltransferase
MLRTMTVYTGFHAIEEHIRRIAHNGNAETPSVCIHYAKPAGPRVKKILEAAREQDIPCREVPFSELDSLTEHLPFAAKDHRGIALVVETDAPADRRLPTADLDSFIAASPPDARRLVLILDSITDPHNIGAIIRSAHQFGASLVVMPKNNTLKDIHENPVVARASAGAVEWVPVAVAANLTRAAENLKDAGYWLYAADSSGEPVGKTRFAPKTAIVLGSEGSGVSRLLAEHCDMRVSIPTCGKIDSLNVSVAAGILLYEAFRQTTESDSSVWA